jgi:hypothetical protein
MFVGAVESQNPAVVVVDVNVAVAEVAVDVERVWLDTVAVVVEAVVKVEVLDTVLMVAVMAVAVGSFAPLHLTRRAPAFTTLSAPCGHSAKCQTTINRQATVTMCRLRVETTNNE